MKQEEMLGYSEAYIKNCRKEHIIYPDHYNEEDKGYRASYFYLHMEAESLAGFDCFNVSPELLTQLLGNTVQVAVMTIKDKTYDLLIFCEFSTGYNKMRGYAVLIDDLEGVQDAIWQYPNAFRKCGGHTPDEYLRYNHPETYKLLVESVYSDEWKKFKKDAKEAGLE